MPRGTADPLPVAILPSRSATPAVPCHCAAATPSVRRAWTVRLPVRHLSIQTASVLPPLFYLIPSPPSRAMPLLTYLPPRPVCLPLRRLRVTHHPIAYSRATSRHIRRHWRTAAARRTATTTRMRDRYTHGAVWFTGRYLQRLRLDAPTQHSRDPHYLVCFLRAQRRALLPPPCHFFAATPAFHHDMCHAPRPYRPLLVLLLPPACACLCT